VSAAELSAADHIEDIPDLATEALVALCEQWCLHHDGRWDGVKKDAASRRVFNAINGLVVIKRYAEDALKCLPASAAQRARDARWRETVRTPPPPAEVVEAKQKPTSKAGGK
jgi:hypothetical protein